MGPKLVAPSPGRNGGACKEPTPAPSSLSIVLKRNDWLDLARKLDWEFSYVDERQAFPEELSGTPWLPQSAWREWDDPFRTSYAEYVAAQDDKEASVRAVREAV